MIYFIQPENESVVKIGYAKNIRNRLAQLQVSNYQKLKVLLLINGDIRLESNLHYMFMDDKLKGEWYFLSDNIKNYIENNMDFDLRFDEGLGDDIEDRWQTRKLRNSLGLSLRDVGYRLNITPQSVKEMESRELSGTITLKRLSRYAKVLGYRLTYKLVPRESQEN